MLYTSAALVDVNNSLEVSYVYVSIIIEYSKLLVLDRQKGIKPATVPNRPRVRQIEMH